MINDIPTGLRVVTQGPLDAKLICDSEALLANLGPSQNLAFTYYKGMEIKCVLESTYYEWREPVGIEVGLMPTHYTYPNGLIVNGVDYSNQSYNFFKILQAIDIDFPVTDIVSVGAGTPIFNDFTGTIAEISAINSPNIIIVKNIDGSITITAPDNSAFKYLLAYYVNSNYVPTVESPSDGSIIRPFVTFDQARAKMIGTGTILNPEFTNATFILQTHSSTALNPTINTLRVIGENSVNLTYTGNDLYVFDSEVLYPLIPKDINNEITQSINMSIGGQLRMVRTTPGGFIRSIGSRRGGSTTGNYNYINITVNSKEEDYLGLFEYTGYDNSIYEGDVLNPDGITLVGGNYNPAISLKWTTVLNPTIPLFYIKGYNLGNPGYSITGAGTLEIVTLVNTGIYAEDTILTFNKLIISPYSDRISVVQGSTFVPGFPGVYEPKNAPAIFAKEASFYINSILFINGGTFGFHGFDKFFKIEGTFNLNGTVNYDTNYYIKTFADLTGTTQNYFQINGRTNSSNLHSKIKYLINSSIVGDFNLLMPNAIIDGIETVSQNPSTNVIPKTSGTISSINGTPVISGIVSYVDDAAASAAGLMPNSLYFNTTINALNIL